MTTSNLDARLSAALQSIADASRRAALTINEDDAMHVDLQQAYAEVRRRDELMYGPEGERHSMSFEVANEFYSVLQMIRAEIDAAYARGLQVGMSAEAMA